MLQQAGSTEAVSKALSLLPTQSVTAHTHTNTFSEHACFLCRMRVKKLPMILALHLKRFKYMEQLHRYTKLSYRVVFPLELRLFNTSGDAVNLDRMYDLVAVVVHCGRYSTPITSPTKKASVWVMGRSRLKLYHRDRFRKTKRALWSGRKKQFSAGGPKKDHFILYYIKGTVWNFRKMTKIEDGHDSFVCTVKKCVSLIVGCWTLTVWTDVTIDFDNRRLRLFSCKEEHFSALTLKTSFNVFWYFL